MVIGTREDSKKQSTLLFDIFLLWMLDILKVITRLTLVFKPMVQELLNIEYIFH